MYADAAEVRDRLKQSGQPSGMWVDEQQPDLLHIAVHAEGDGAVTAFAGGAPITLKPVGEPGERLFAGSLRHPVVRRATISLFAGVERDDGRMELIGPKNAAGYPTAPTFYGLEAPAAPERVEQLKGTVRKYEVPSEASGGTRAVIVYLPPDYDPEKPLPPEYKGGKPAVVYFGDGGVVGEMAAVIEPLILAQKMRAVVLVGSLTSDRVERPPNLPAPATKPATAGATPPNPFADDPRAMEYLEPREAMRASDPDTAAVHEYMFDRHFTFFADELPKWAEETLGVSDDPRDRVISGFSNSAGFVMTLARRRPGQYAGVIANSMAGGRPPSDNDIEAFAGLADGAQPPRFLLSSGTWEQYFRQATDQWDAYVRRHGAESRRLTIVGGHDAAIWELAVVEGLPWLLPPHESRRVTGR